MKTFTDKMHTWGRIWTISAIAVLFTVPLGITLYYNAWPEFSTLWKALISVIPIYWATAIIEVVTYTPLLGAGGTYLSFVTGNIVNLKLPCAISAMESAKVKANSEEGEVISTIAIATSSIVTTVILAIGVLAFAPFLETFTSNELLMPAFKQVIPALFGALGAGYFVKNWKISFAPIIIMLAILVFVPTIGASTLIFPGIVASVLCAFLMYKVGFLDKKEN